MFLDFQYELVLNGLDEEDRSCNPDLISIFDDSLYQLANDELERKFGCTIPFIPSFSSNDTGKPIEICRDAETGSKAMGKYLDIESSQLGNMPCARMDIFLGMPYISNNSEVENPHPYMGYGLRDKAFVLLYFKTDVKVKRTVYDYDFLTLVGELGGYVGLLIGISLAELIIHINSLIVNGVVKQYGTKEQQTCSCNCKN